MQPWRKLWKVGRKFRLPWRWGWSAAGPSVIGWECAAYILNSTDENHKRRRAPQGSWFFQMCARLFSLGFSQPVWQILILHHRVFLKCIRIHADYHCRWEWLKRRCASQLQLKSFNICSVNKEDELHWPWNWINEENLQIWIKLPGAFLLLW